MALSPVVTISGFYFVIRTLKYTEQSTLAATKNAETAIKNADFADRWKRTEYLASQAKDFFNDPVVDRAFKMVDWNDRIVRNYGSRGYTIQVVHSNKHRDEIRLRQVKTRDPKTNVTVVSLESALKDHDIDANFESAEILIRDDFDWLLFRLGQFESMLENKLFEYNEFERHMRYMLDAFVGNTQHSEFAAVVIDKYAKRYDFEEARSLIKKRAAKPRKSAGNMGKSDNIDLSTRRT